jgi:hypothetical protein
LAVNRDDHLLGVLVDVNGDRRLRAAAEQHGQRDPDQRSATPGSATQGTVTERTDTQTTDTHVTPNSRQHGSLQQKKKLVLI